MFQRLFIWAKGKLYVIPTLYGLAFSTLSILLLGFDKLAYEKFGLLIPDVFFNDGPDSVTIVVLVISSLITMVTITFSIMMVVLTIYGSQLSSRSLQDFLSKKITLKILGFYIGTLIFSLIQLAFNDYSQKSMGISSIVCMTLLIIGVIVLVYFIHFISKSIQINIYIDEIVKDTMNVLSESKKHVFSSVYIKGGDIEDYNQSLKGDSWNIESNKAGYIQYYDVKKLLDLAAEFNIKILCDTLIGEYILPEDVFVKIYSLNSNIKKDELKHKILDSIVIGDEPDLFKDISTGSKRLVDVALKALSPGINDATTAISCIQNIGYLLHEISKGLEVNVYLDEDKEIRVVIRSISFHRLLFNHFYQIKHYGSEDIMIIESILAALTKIAKDSNHEIKEQVWEFSKYLIDEVNMKSYHIMEQQVLAERIYQLSRATDTQYDLYNWKTSTDK